MPLSKLSSFSMNKGDDSKFIKEDVTSTTSPCLSSSKYCANCLDGLRNLNLNLTAVSRLNSLGVGILVMFVIGF